MIPKACIVAGIDLGPDTEKVLAYAAPVAAAEGTCLLLLYVIDYLMTPPSYLASYVEEEKRRDEGEMTAWKSRLAQSGVDARISIVLGRLHDAFGEVVGEARPDLLVIGHRGHLIRSSSSERLIRSLELPMLVVRGRAAENASIGSVHIRRILCPVDFSANAERALDAAKRYAAMFSAELRLVHVVPSHVAGEKLGKADRGKFEEVLRAEAEGRMTSFSGRAGLPGGEILFGNPADTIPAIAERISADLVVMGARGQSSSKVILIGSTTETLLRTSPCPVLVVH